MFESFWCSKKGWEWWIVKKILVLLVHRSCCFPFHQSGPESREVIVKTFAITQWFPFLRKPDQILPDRRKSTVIGRHKQLYSKCFTLELIRFRYEKLSFKYFHISWFCLRSTVTYRQGGKIGGDPDTIIEVGRGNNSSCFHLYRAKQFLWSNYFCAINTFFCFIGHGK